MKLDTATIKISSNAELFLRDIPVEQIVHPPMDPLDPYKPFHTGLFHEAVRLDGEAIGFFSYVPKSFSPSGAQVMIFPDDGPLDAEGWLEQTQWAQVAEQYGCMLCVLPPPAASWQTLPDSGLAYAQAVYLSTLDRCLYNTNESVFYVVGCGAGNSAALTFSLTHCDWIAGLVACGPQDDCHALLKQLQTAKVGQGEPALCRETAMHAWIIQREDTPMDQLADYLKEAAEVSPSALKNFAGDVFLSDPGRHFAAINEYPVAQVWISVEEALASLTPFQLHEQIWLFLSKVKRWRGAPCGSLRPSRTPEQERLIYHERVIDGYKRSWRLFVPSRFYAHPEERYPLVVCTHGYSCTAEIWAENSDWHIVGEARNFFVLYMTALPHPFYGNWVPLPLWNCCYWKNAAYPDDCSYILQAIDETCGEYPINQNRIYAAGHSNGGAMCQELMFRHPERFAAFGPAGYAAGDLCERIPDLSAVERPVFLHKAEFDVFSAADMRENTPNWALIQALCRVNHADFSTPYIRRNGQYEHFTYLTEDRVPLVRMTVTKNMNHTYTPELAWMTWDGFFAHFERAPDGRIRYIY